jgi:hypothetical protein
MCPVWSRFTCTQCLCVLYEVTRLSEIIRIGLFVFVSSQSLAKPVSEDLKSVLDGNVTAGGDIFRETFEIFVERLVAYCVYGSSSKAAYVSTVTSPQRLQSRHCLLTARDQIWRTLRTGQVMQLELFRWSTVRSSVRERGVNGFFFPSPLLVQLSAASQYRTYVWKGHSKLVTELASLCFVCEHLRYLAMLRSCRTSTVKTDTPHRFMLPLSIFVCFPLHISCYVPLSSSEPKGVKSNVIAFLWTQVHFLDRGTGKGRKLVPDMAIRGIQEQLSSFLVWSLNRDEWLVNFALQLFPPG